MVTAAMLQWWQHCSSSCRTASNGCIRIKQCKKDNNQPAVTVQASKHKRDGTVVTASPSWHNGSIIAAAYAIEPVMMSQDFLKTTINQRQQCQQARRRQQYHGIVELQQLLLHNQQWCQYEI